MIAMKKILLPLLLVLIADWSSAVDTKKINESYYHYLYALTVQRAGNAVQSIPEFEITLQLNPKAVSVYRELIISYLTAGYKDNAMNLAKKLETLNPDHTMHLFLGEFYSLIGDTTGAITSFNKVLKKDTSNMEATMALAAIYSETDPEKAVEYWEKYLRLDPNSAEAYYQLGIQLIQLNKKTETEQALLNAISIDPDMVNARTALAQVYEYGQEYDKSAGQYQYMVDIDTGNVSLLQHLASLYYMSKNYAKAETTFKTILTLIPGDVTATMWLALVNEQKKNFTVAAELMEYCIKKNPTLFMHIRLSHYYAMLGKHDKAMGQLKKAAKLNPESYEPYFMLGLGYMDKKKYSTAEKYFNDALKLNPSFKEAYFYLGLVYDQTKQYEKSEQSLRKAIELDPKDPVTLNFLGYSMADRNVNLQEAEQLIRQALAVDPNNCAYIDSLAWVQYRNGNYANAENTIDKTTGKLDDPVIYEHMGDIKTELNKPREAVDYYKKALDLDKNNKILKIKYNTILKSIKK
jgi:tetratricopeptide (TPR) repeat protein